MQVHHASQGGGESHAVGDGPITVKSDHLVLFGHVVQKTEIRKENNSSILRFNFSDVFKYGQVFLIHGLKNSKRTYSFIYSNFIEGFHVGDFHLTPLIDAGIDQ